MSAQFENLIDGARVAGNDSTRNINPSDIRDVVGIYALADASQAEAAIEAARTAASAWARTTGAERFAILDRGADEVLRRRDELGNLLSREEGKTLPEAVAEVNRAGQILKFHAGEAVRAGGEHLGSVRPGVEITVTHEPVGVIALITPWNFPIAIPAWKIAPALAHGNTVVFKPAELAPGSAWELVDILHRAGLPRGVLNLVMGRGGDIGDTLVGHPDVDAVSFTGSVETGARILATAQRHGARVQLEMGGKNPLVVLADADLDNAVECAVQGSFYSTGQRCTASSRLVVVDTIHDAFAEKLAVRMRSLVVDNARKPGTDIGPVVDQGQLDIDQRYIRIASEVGAEVVGGDRLVRTSDGWYLAPALLLGTSNDQVINRQEVFGPVASVVKVGNYEEALAVANDTEFGLTSGICTTSLSAASHFRRNSTAGMVMVNLPTAGIDYHVPFGGRGASSYGPREQGTAARAFYTTSKTAYVLSGGA